MTEKTSVTYMNNKEEVCSIDIPDLKDLTWQQTIEWMDENQSNTEGSAIRYHFCKKYGIEFQYEAPFIEKENIHKESFDVYWKHHQEKVAYRQKQEQERLSALLKCVKDDLQRFGVKEVLFDWAGSGDDMDYANAEVILTEETKSNHDTSFTIWNPFLDHLSNHIVSAFYTGSFNNEGGGGQATWNLKDNTLEYSSYYNEMRQIDDESGTMEMA